MAMIDDVQQFQAEYGAGVPIAGGTSLGHVRRGELLRIPAGAYNAFVDAALRDRDQALSMRTGGSSASSDAGVVHVRNDSGGDLSRFQVLGIDSPVIAPSDDELTFLNQVIVSGVTPDVDLHTNLFVVLLDSLGDGKIGRAVLSGLCPVVVDVSDEAHLYADVTDAQSGYLTSGTTGAAQILWKESGTGPVWALVRLGVPPNPFGYESLVSTPVDQCAVIDESNPDATLTFGTYPLGVEVRVTSDDNDELRLLIRFDRVYAAGEDVERFVLNLLANFYLTGNNAVGDADFTLEQSDLEIRPITEDFDPASVTWNTMPSTGALLATEVATPYASVMHGVGAFLQFDVQASSRGRALFVMPGSGDVYGVEVRFEKPADAWASAVASWALMLDVSNQLYGYALLK